MEPAAAYRFIHDGLMLDASSRLNLATFVTTWMDQEADKLMAETFDKNMVDKDEYPATAAIESRCVSMVADPATATGVSTIGSSEAVMLGGLALKWRWRQRVGDNPKTGWRTRTPNLVMGSNVQVVWEKFCRYFDIEPGYSSPTDHHRSAASLRQSSNWRVTPTRCPPIPRRCGHKSPARLSPTDPRTAAMSWHVS